MTETWYTADEAPEPYKQPDQHRCDMCCRIIGYATTDRPPLATWEPFVMTPPRWRLDPMLLCLDCYGD